LLAKYEGDVKEWHANSKHRNIEEKAKALLGKKRLLVLDLKDLLRWKLGDNFSKEMKGLKEAELQLLWIVWKEMETADVGETTVPTVPKVTGINETELGCIAQKKRKAAIGMGGSLIDENLQKLTVELFSICAA